VDARDLISRRRAAAGFRTMSHLFSAGLVRMHSRRSIEILCGSLDPSISVAPPTRSTPTARYAPGLRQGDPAASVAVGNVFALVVFSSILGLDLRRYRPWIVRTSAGGFVYDFVVVLHFSLFVTQPWAAGRRPCSSVNGGLKLHASRIVRMITLVPACEDRDVSPLLAFALRADFFADIARR